MFRPPCIFSVSVYAQALFLFYLTLMMFHISARFSFLFFGEQCPTPEKSRPAHLDGSAGLIVYYSLFLLTFNLK